MDPNMKKYHKNFLEFFYFASALCKVMPLKWRIPYTFKEFATMQQYTNILKHNAKLQGQ
jgi:hypothetical protein